MVFDVMYTSPDDSAGNFDPSHLVSPMQMQHDGGCNSSLDDDQRMLLDIEQNIVNLERSLKQGIFI